MTSNAWLAFSIIFSMNLHLLLKLYFYKPNLCDMITLLKKLYPIDEKCEIVYMAFVKENSTLI